MTPEQRRKKVYDLTYAYLLRPDPVNWLVAADLLEEDGQDEAATKWRRRASHLEPLRAAFAEMKGCVSKYAYTLDFSKKEVAVPVGIHNVTLCYTGRACTSVEILTHGERGPRLHVTYLGVFWGARARYVTLKLIQVIDWCTDFELHPPAPTEPDEPPVQ
jgi:hypothetical protein